VSAPGRSTRARLALLVGAGFVAASCHSYFVLPLDARRVCAEAFCATPVEEQMQELYVVDLDAPAGGRLRQATCRLSSDQGAPCARGAPVIDVTIDDVRVEHGPVLVEGRHRVRLHFHERPEGGPPRLRDSTSLELEVQLGADGRVSCLSLPLVVRSAR
jgi:hypothetical protein